MIRNAVWPPEPLPKRLVDSVDDAKMGRVQEKFPNYAYWEDPYGMCNFSNPYNITGDQQRAFEYYWTLRGVDGGGIGLCVGSSYLVPPFSVGVDKNGGGYTDDTRSVWIGSTMGARGESLPFLTNSFDVITSIHSFEHMERPTDTLVSWLRICKQGGYIAIICPDNTYNPVMEMDPDHKFATDEGVLIKIVNDAVYKAKKKGYINRVELLYANTLKNNFSFDIVLAKE